MPLAINKTRLTNAGFARVVLAISVIAVTGCLFGQTTSTEQIKVSVVNGKNGKPITDECLNIAIGAWGGWQQIGGRTNSHGIVLLRWGKD